MTQLHDAQERIVGKVKERRGKKPMGWHHPRATGSCRKVLGHVEDSPNRLEALDLDQ